MFCFSIYTKNKFTGVSSLVRIKQEKEMGYFSWYKVCPGKSFPRHRKYKPALRTTRGYISWRYEGMLIARCFCHMKHNDMKHNERCILLKNCLDVINLDYIDTSYCYMNLGIK